MNGISSSRKAERGLPASAASRSAISSARSSIPSAILSSRPARSPGVVAAQPSNASWAAFTAASTSRLPESGALAITSPVAGLTTASRLPSAGAVNLPPIMFLRLLGLELRPLACLRLAVAVAVAIIPPWSGFLFAVEHVLDRGVLDADPLGDGRVSDPTGGDVDPEPKPGVAAGGLGDAVVGEGQHVGKGCVGEREGRGDRHRA